MLRRSLLAAGAAFLSAPALPRLTLAAAEPASFDRYILHVLDRLAFGASTADATLVKEIGVERYIAEQLNPEALGEPPALTQNLAELATQKLDPVQLWREYGPPRLFQAQPAAATPEEEAAWRQRARIIQDEASAARVWRALYSPRQLQEVMVDFWFNHFNVYANKGLDHLWLGAYENEAIRPHALGRFRDLLGATAHHPAMLFYLDNFQNSAPGTRGPGGRELGINENYARELMELHTLGVDGGYIQADVVALAHILTGWSMVRPRFLPPSGNGFAFYPERHDKGAKTFLGRNIPVGGEEEGETALDMLSKSPATAMHVASKLVQYFVADTPPPALVERVAARFRETDGDIRAVLTALFASAEFRDSAGRKFKSPYRYVLSAVRAAGVPVNNVQPLLNQMAREGQPLYGCATPDGWKDTKDAWLSPDATTLRVSFAAALSAGQLPLRDAPPDPDKPVIEASAPAPEPVDAGALEKLLQPILTERTRSAVAEASAGLRAGLILGGPDFMWR
ncbi:MAG TPA: DUF1800 domain-containing protein [Stellaceae bacterium]|nr:DUF1800 domain-containing protein [Stellaceae bacterium]